ncbi:DUF7007 domain-containing protein [Kineosporia succinea]|uniref:DUF7007 domain-containing protein n=1 Tax=Kineosporia succinea TaxID=84632 RepID=A0ABT9P6S9_9ACTN|nr:hypothetical protein [Kineosporia succinea]MDP9827895.1 hypothetical protein [Kineosporia succinea]
MLTTETPSLSPWGSIRSFEPVGDDGILRVHTDSSTGYFVPRQLNARVHGAWQVRTGWYRDSETDPHWAIVAITFPTLFPEDTVTRAHELQQQAHPACYTTVLADELAAVTSPSGIALPAATTPPATTHKATTFKAIEPRVTQPDASSVHPQLTALMTATNNSENPLPARTPRTPEAPDGPQTPDAPEALAPEPEPMSGKPPTRRPAWVRKAGPIARQAWADWHETVPTGFVGVVASPDADPSDESWHLVPVKEYEERGTFRFVVDPERHETWPGHP